MRFTSLIGCALIWTTLPVSAQATTWSKLDFLLGNWVGIAGEKETPLGSGQGAFSFEPQLDRKIIVRHNHAAYNTGEKHDDLMIVYLDAPNDTPRAIYFDAEGHVIRYNVAFPSANAVTFESDGTQPGPKYRLSYWIEKSDKGVLRGKFEIAPPGAAYAPYMSWTSRKN